MRITHISTADNRGGGARSAYRLHRALIMQGIDSRLYVKNKYTADDSVSVFAPSISYLKRTWFRIRRRWETGDVGYLTTKASIHVGFAPAKSPVGLAPLGQLPSADVVNLHWVAGFWDFRLLAHLHERCKAVVWRLSDMNPFTGGCFYDNHCGRFTEECGCCPCLQSNKKCDLSRRSLQLKKRVIAALPRDFLSIVAQSRWLEERIKASAIFGSLPVVRIPNGIDTNKFRPRNVGEARAKFGLKQDHAVILFVAQSLSNPAKGGSFFVEAVRRLSASYNAPITVMALGNGNLPRIDNVSTVHMNFEDDEKLACAYSAADVFVITSLQDNLPNTVMESMSCGTPVVGFYVGGVPDMVVDGETGFLAPARDTALLAQRIKEIISDSGLRTCFSIKGREHIIENFSLERQTKSYINLYESLLSQRNTT